MSTRPPTSPRPSSKSSRRRRNALPLLVNPATAMLSDFGQPVFRIGGKTDPGRFVNQHQHSFLILGFHDEERSDSLEDRRDHLLEYETNKCCGNNDFGSGCSSRKTLSPVREHHDGLEVEETVRLIPVDTRTIERIWWLSNIVFIRNLFLVIKGSFVEVKIWLLRLLEKV